MSRAAVKARLAKLEKAAKVKAGRPKLPALDLEEMGRLVMDHNASDRELGLMFGVSHQTIERNYGPFLAKKRAERRLWLKGVQTDKAKKGDVTMQIWLGKNELDQTDKQQHEHTGPDGGPMVMIMSRPK
jgi:hypothetical protein